MTTSSTETSPKTPIIFDENFGRPHVDRLKAFIADQPTLDADVQHVLDFQKQGVWDESWIPEKAKAGCILITQDRGKRGAKKGEPLPRVCTRHRMTTVVLSSGASQLKMEEKIQLLLSVWPAIIQLTSREPGSRFILTLRPDGSLQGRLVDQTPQEILDAAANKRQVEPDNADNPP